MINANLIEADYAYGKEDYSQCIIHLETALTSLHNLIIQFLESIMERYKGSCRSYPRHYPWLYVWFVQSLALINKISFLFWAVT